MSTQEEGVRAVSGEPRCCPRESEPNINWRTQVT